MKMEHVSHALDPLALINMVSLLRELNNCAKQQGLLSRPGKDDHEIWSSPVTWRYFTADHSIKSRQTANAVLKQAGLPEAF